MIDYNLLSCLVLSAFRCLNI